MQKNYERLSLKELGLQKKGKGSEKRIISNRALPGVSVARYDLGDTIRHLLDASHKDIFTFIIDSLSRENTLFSKEDMLASAWILRKYHSDWQSVLCGLQYIAVGDPTNNLQRVTIQFLDASQRKELSHYFAYESD